MRFFVIYFFIVFWMACPTWAAFEHLQENSPFLPPDYKPRGGGKSAKPVNTGSSRGLELTGMIQIGKDWSFSFYEPGKKRSFWVKMGDQAAEIQVVDVNSNQKTVTIEDSGAREVVKLKEGKLTGTSGAGKGPVLSGAAVGSKSTDMLSSSKDNNNKSNKDKPPPPNFDDLPPLSPEDEAALQMLEKLFSGLGPQDIPPLPAP